MSCFNYLCGRRSLIKNQPLLNAVKDFNYSLEGNIGCATKSSKPNHIDKLQLDGMLTKSFGGNSTNYLILLTDG